MLAETNIVFLRGFPSVALLGTAFDLFAERINTTETTDTDRCPTPLGAAEAALNSGDKKGKLSG
jgi:hypothetical protein